MEPNLSAPPPADWRAPRRFDIPIAIALAVATFAALALTESPVG